MRKHRRHYKAKRFIEDNYVAEEIPQKRSNLKYFLKMFIVLFLCASCSFWGGVYGSKWVEAHNDLSSSAVSRYYGTSLHTFDFLTVNIPKRFIAAQALEERMKTILGDNYSSSDEMRFSKFAMTLAINEMNDVLSDDLKPWKTYNAYKTELDYRVNKWFTNYEASNDEYKALEELENTYYVKFNTFSSDESLKVLKNNIDNINKYENLVLDLRDNGGGRIGILREVADLFLEKGEIICYIGTKDEISPYYTIKDRSIDCKNIIILQGNNTASASEMLITSLSDLRVRKIGSSTYGKGVGSAPEDSSGYTNVANSKIAYDEIVYLSDASFLSLFWLDKNEESILNVGIKPDVEFSSSDDEDLIKIIEETIIEMNDM